MDTSEGFNLHWAHGNGWEAKEAQRTPVKRSKSSEPTYSGKHKAGMVGPAAKNISAGQDGRSANDLVHNRCAANIERGWHQPQEKPRAKFRD